MNAIELLKERTPFLWTNNALRDSASALPTLSLGIEDMRDAQARLCRFAPLIEELFPEETGNSFGIIESGLIRAERLAVALAGESGFNVAGIMVKEDHDLPVAGSIKARGGIYEVLCFAERLAMEHGLLDYKDNYIKLARVEIRELFKKYTISVGSTGNLGLSIGVIGSALGFNVDVHMSHEAKEWKKERLRKRGVNVVEHKTDYTAAVSAGRLQAEKDPFNFFVDDENSIQLFLGYSVAAFRLKAQLENMSVKVDAENPLFVYLPCGIGGAPGGIAFGLKVLFGDAVHCFFAEPVEAPCMALGLISGKHDEASVYDIGLGVKTDADGLAVSRPSGFVGKFIMPLISGALTVEDSTMYKYVWLAHETEGLKLEPSATAGFAGPDFVLNSDSGKNYLDKYGIDPSKATHILWTTGGRYVPEEEYNKFLEKGKAFN